MSKKEVEQIKLREVDGVEIISVMDNSVDFLSWTDKKEVHQCRQWTKKRCDLPVAEHGFSALIRVLQDGKSNSVLFDTGVSPNGVVENAMRMGLDLGEVECIVLSHGHHDHCGGLLSALKAANKVDLPVIVHDDMFKTRGTVSHSNAIRQYPEFPNKEKLSQAHLISTKRPLQISDDKILVTGEIPRETSFEKGHRQHRVLVDGSWHPDPWIWDDRAIIVNVKGKGLVILSGCAHSGIINTVSYARRITGITSVYMVMGGFHLAGREFEKRIEETVEELRRISPKLIVPSHCTGWKGTRAIAEALPDAFVWNSVGNLYRLMKAE